MSAKEAFAVMAKPVGPLCNMRCSYCYYLETGRFYPNEQDYRMSEELLESYIRQYIAASPGPTVPFTWHGGEPTLAGLEFYRLAVRLQKKYLPEGWRCWNNLQTNGLLLDDDWCKFLAAEHFDVGLSIDGTARLHDAFRKDRGGAGTYARAEAAVRALQAHGLEPDLLCTVTSASALDPLGVYRALRALNTGWMQFIPIVRRGEDGALTPDSVTGEAYGDFLCAVFDEWILNDLGRLDVQLFAETARVMTGGGAGLCWMAPTCGRVLIVEHDGSVYACDHFVDPEHRLGSLESCDLAALADSPEQIKFGNNKSGLLPGQCRRCPYLYLCNGGCPKDRFAADENGEIGLNILCAGLKRFFAHADAPVKKVIALRQRNFPPQAIMAQLRADAQERWRGIGRNDPCPCGSGKKAKQCCWERRP